MSLSKEVIIESAFYFTRRMMDAKFVAKVMQYIVQYYAHSRVKRLNKLNIQTLILSARNLALSPTNHQLYHVYTKKNCAIEKS